MNSRFPSLKMYSFTVEVYTKYGVSYFVIICFVMFPRKVATSGCLLISRSYQGIITGEGGGWSLLLTLHTNLIMVNLRLIQCSYDRLTVILTERAYRCIGKI